VNSSFPVLIPHPETTLQRISTGTVLNIGGIWGQVKSGQTWVASDGKRFVFSADSMTVIYAQNGKVYAQASHGFINEVRTYSAVAAGRSAHPWIQVAQVEVRLICGIVAGASGVGFAIVIGSEIAEFVVDNRENFAKWNRQLSAILKARTLLKHDCPVLYDKVFSAVLHQVFKDVKAHIPDAITPEVVAFGVGVVIGSVGKKLAQGKFSLFIVIFAIVEQLVVRFAVSLIPGAIRITEDEYRRMAQQIISQLRTAGVLIQDGEARKIIEEVRQHPAKVKQAFDVLKRDFEQSMAAQAAHQYAH
jgi:hypothetical protein